MPPRGSPVCEASTMPDRPRAAIYTRISKDVTGEGAVVARQEADCRELADRRDLEVVEVFSDNDTSAYTGKARPGYEQLLAGIEAGRIDAVVVWHTDRLYRRMADLERYIAVCQPHDVPTYAVQAGHLDLSTPAGRMTARTLGSVAQYESEQKAERQRRANLQRAQQGRHLASRRCFGYEGGNIQLRADEAELIREAYQSIIDGGTVAGIARQWNEAGWRTPQKQNLWDGSTVSQLLRGPRNAGMGVYHGEIVTGEDGEPVPVVWEPIVDRDLWDAAQLVLRDPSRSWPSGSPLLLSGIAHCGVCGSVMLSGGTRMGRRRIRCGAQGGHAYREAEPIEELVVSVLLAYLSRPDIVTQLDDPDDKAAPDVQQIRKDLAALQVRSDNLVATFSDGLITELQLRDGQKRIAGQRAGLEARLPQRRSPAVLRLVRSPDPAVTWADMDIDEQRRVVDELLEVTILPGGGSKEAAYLDWRRRIVNPDTVRIEWR